MYVRATANLHKNVSHYAKLAIEEAQSINREKSEKAELRKKHSKKSI